MLCCLWLLQFIRPNICIVFHMLPCFLFASHRIEQTIRLLFVNSMNCFWFMECAQKAWFTFVNWCFRVTIHFWTFHIYAILFFTTQPEHTILEVWFLAKYHKISLSLECEIVSLSLIQCYTGSVQQWVKHGWILSSVHFYFDHFAHSFRSIFKIYGFDCFSCHHNHP